VEVLEAQVLQEEQLEEHLHQEVVQLEVRQEAQAQTEAAQLEGQQEVHLHREVLQEDLLAHLLHREVTVARAHLEVEDLQEVVIAQAEALQEVLVRLEAQALHVHLLALQEVAEALLQEVEVAVEVENNNHH